MIAGQICGKRGPLTLLNIAHEIRQYIAERKVASNKDKNIDGRAGKLPQWLSDHGYGQLMRARMAARNAPEPPGAKQMKVPAFELLGDGASPGEGRNPALPRSAKEFCDRHGIDLADGCTSTKKEKAKKKKNKKKNKGGGGGNHGGNGVVKSH